MLRLEDLGITRAESQLDGGLPLVVYERTGMPVRIMALFDGGSRHDPSDQDGLAHFSEHLRLSGTSSFPDKLALGEYAESFGGGFNATTSLTYQNVLVTVAEPEELEKACRLLAELMQRPAYGPRHLEGERGAILQERRQIVANPGRWLYSVWREALYAGTPLSRSTIGSAESISGIALDDIRQFAHRHLMAPLKIIACGDVSLGLLKDLLEKALSPVQPAPSLSLHQAIPLPELPEHTAAYSLGTTKNLEVLAGYRLPARLSPAERGTLWAIQSLLSGGRSSRLYRILRLERGLTYSVSGSTSFQPDLGSLAVQTACATGGTPEVSEIFRQEFARLADEPVPEDELARAKYRRGATLRERLQTVESVIGFHLESELLDADPLTLSDHVALVQATDSAKVQEFAQRYFRPENFRSALCGDLPPEQEKA